MRPEYARRAHWSLGFTGSLDAWDLWDRALKGTKGIGRSTGAAHGGSTTITGDAARLNTCCAGNATDIGTPTNPASLPTIMSTPHLEVVLLFVAWRCRCQGWLCSSCTCRAHTHTARCGGTTSASRQEDPGPYPARCLRLERWWYGACGRRTALRVRSARPLRDDRFQTRSVLAVRLDVQDQTHRLRRSRRRLLQLGSCTRSKVVQAAGQQTGSSSVFVATWSQEVTTSVRCES